jgi:hypothetical protein
MPVGWAAVGIRVRAARPMVTPARSERWAAESDTDSERRVVGSDDAVVEGRAESRSTTSSYTSCLVPVTPRCSRCYSGSTARSLSLIDRGCPQQRSETSVEEPGTPRWGLVHDVRDSEHELCVHEMSLCALFSGNEVTLVSSANANYDDEVSARKTISGRISTMN